MAQLKYRCPVCKKNLTKREFERAFKIHEAQKEHVKALERNLEEKERRFREQEKRIKQQAREAEHSRTRRIVEGKDLKIRNLNETIKLLKRGQTPQEYGPEFERKLVKRLKGEFKCDDIQHKGKGGDVLHIVMEGGKVAGSIIYECKWTPRISGSHIRQAARAKMSRRADFAVLVTCGTKRGFGGFTEMSGVLVVAPAGVVSLAGLCRMHVVKMFHSGVEKKQRAKVATQLLNFIKSPEFKNPIEEIVRTSEHLREGIMEEFRWHKSDWERRWNAYGRIHWDGFAIQENLRSVFHGGKPKPMIQPRANWPSLPLSGMVGSGTLHHEKVKHDTDSEPRHRYAG